jgi:general secretion pathway protein N
MIRRCACVIVAMGSFSLNDAMGQAAIGVSLHENNTVQTTNTEQHPTALKNPAAQQPPPGGNPLWGIPVSSLSATRERPIFSVSRRPPAPPVAVQPVAEAPAQPKPTEPERPHLTLVGTAIGKIQNVAVVFDPATKTLVRLHVGEAVSGWFLRSVDLRTITLEKNSQTVTLALPAPGSGPAIPPAVSEASGASRRF